MPQFQVPQFIEEKPKIIGPLTLAQFLYIAGAAGISVIAFYTLDSFFLSFLIVIIAGGIAIGLAFIQINGQNLPAVIGAALTYWQKPKTYTWQKEFPMTEIDVSALEKIEVLRRNMSLQEKIKSATLNITTGKIPLFKGKKQPVDKKKEYQVVTYLTGEKRLAKRVDYP